MKNKSRRAEQLGVTETVPELDAPSLRKNSPTFFCKTLILSITTQLESKHTEH